MGSEPAPHDISYGDGSPIADSDIQLIRDILWDEAAQFRWEAGDLLIVDNERLAHGRRAYTGPRRVLVSLARSRTHAPARDYVVGGQ